MEVGLFVFLVSCLTFANGQDGAATVPQWVEIIDKCFGPDSNRLRTVALDSDCREYAVCPDQISRRPTVQLCSPGTAFDLTNNICNFIDQVDCNGRNIPDPCEGQLLGFVKDELRSLPQQGAGLLCRDGLTLANYQCPPCNEFAQTDEGCVPIVGCDANDTISDVCNMEAVEGDSSQFVAVGVETRTTMQCGTGTTFKPELCLCT